MPSYSISERLRDHLMNVRERDNDQLGIIIRYCDRMAQAQEHFGNEYQAFLTIEPYQDSCSLCLIQIGEAVHRLSDGFCDAHPEVAWSKIYGMRCHLVHGYEAFDAEIAWDAIQNQIPPLRAFCERHFMP